MQQLKYKEREVFVEEPQQSLVHQYFLVSNAVNGSGNGMTVGQALNSLRHIIDGARKGSVLQKRAEELRNFIIVGPINHRSN